jgi:Tol biopolymer transport system component
MSGDGFRFLAGTDEAMYPFWSPDSREIAFFAQGKLKAVDAAGGAVRNIADAPLGRGGAWGPDGTMLFCPEPRKPLMRVSANGAGAVEATKLAEPNEGHRWPGFLADGKHFIYTVLAPNKPPSIAVGSVDTVAQNRVLIEGSTFALPTRVGWILFQRENSLVGKRIDGEKLSGDAVVVVNTVSGGGPSALAASVADDGTLVYARGLAYVSSELLWVDRNGRELEKVASNAVFFCPAVSHDGRRVAADVSNQESGAGDIWIYDVAHKRQSRLTYEPGNESSPLWSPDDKRIYHVSEASGPDDLWVVPSGGTGAPEKVFGNDRAKRLTDMSRDGKWIIFNSSSGRVSSAIDIWTYSTTEKVAKPWLETPFGESNATLSPDGKWIAYQSNESGRNEIYVRAFPESDEKWMVSSNGGATPTWRGDGREIFYITADQKMMAVPVKPGNPFDAGTPAVLFDVTLRPHIARQYDVSPDGTKFLVNRQVQSEGSVPATVLQNWVARHR